MLVIEGKISEDRFNGGGVRVIADRIYDITEAQSLFAQALRLTLKDPSLLAPLREILENRRGGACPIEIDYHNQYAKCLLRLPENWQVTLHEDLLINLKNLLGDADVAVRY